MSIRFRVLKHPAYGDRTFLRSDLDHFEVRRILGTVEGGGRKEVWLAFVKGEKLQLPPNCIVNEPKIWNALATMLPQRDVDRR